MENKTESIKKLNHVLGWLKSMSFHRPNTSVDLKVPIDDLTDIIKEMEQGA